MGRRSRFVAGVLSLTMVLFAVAAVAMAAVVTPKDGRYAIFAKGSSGSQYFNVSGHGRKVTFELSLSVICETPNGPFHTATALTSTILKPGSAVSPLAIKNGKFSYNGPIYGGPSTKGEGHLSGTFKSATKLVASAQFSWPDVTVLPGVEGNCEAAKATFSGSHE